MIATRRRPGLLPAALALLAAWSVAAHGQNTAEVDFMLECQGCHRPGGDGWPGMVPRLNGQVSKFLHSGSGRAYLVRVPGVAQSSLSDARLAAVLNWMVRELDPAHLPADFQPYSPDEVGQWRRRIVRNVSEERRQVLAEAGQQVPDAYGAEGALYARPDTLP